MKLKPTYVLHPGIVTSRQGGVSHFINAARLAELYGVPMDACAIAPEPRAFDRAASWRTDPYAGLIHLYPRPDGVYVLPSVSSR
ncbi:hypothetical protein [Paraburkholderia sp. BR14320]|uniref:hypothetical protein n=1 Tax=unclassified Paraburkholderia TaxID=2615204 RepID=UPI0034CD3F32